MVVTYDLSGDDTSTAIWSGSGSQITPIVTIRRPNSLGIFYSIITQYLGFDRDSDEYKVMGLAAYGEPTFDLSFHEIGNRLLNLDLSHSLRFAKEPATATRSPIIPARNRSDSSSPRQPLTSAYHLVLVPEAARRSRNRYAPSTR